MKAEIKLGFAPTRRAIFSAPAAVEYRKLTADRLRELGINFVDIDDVNEEGLLYDDAGLEKIIAKFQAEKVDGLFIPHANFGTEYECARLAKALNVPVLLWGPRDERPDERGMRLRDSQCGLFATGKVLRRFRVPFTYMNNCNLTDPIFERASGTSWRSATWCAPSGIPGFCKSGLVPSISGPPCATRASCWKSSTSSWLRSRCPSFTRK